MLEVGWSELLVIAIILIVVVGPKDLPGMMRTFGKMMGRVRTMANEFRGQFDEAMREAELDDVRKGLSEVNKYNPASSLRDAINPIRQLGQDIKSDLQKASDVSVKSKAGEGTPVAELASDPVVDPEPLRAEPAPAATTPAKPMMTAAATVTPAAVASKPVAKAKPAAKKKATEAATDYPPPVKKVVKRKASEPHVEHDVHVVTGDKKAAGRTTKKAIVTASSEPVAKAEPAAKAKPAPKKKTAKAGDA
jgi:sec-independent protein translocase protein TatB